MRKQVNLDQSDMFKSFDPGQKIKMTMPAGHEWRGVISPNGRWITWQDGYTSLLEDYFNDIKMDIGDTDTL